MPLAQFSPKWLYFCIFSLKVELVSASRAISLPTGLCRYILGETPHSDKTQSAQKIFPFPLCHSLLPYNKDKGTTGGSASLYVYRAAVGHSKLDTCFLSVQAIFSCLGSPSLRRPPPRRASLLARLSDSFPKTEMTLAPPPPPRRNAAAAAAIHRRSFFIAYICHFLLHSSSRSHFSWIMSFSTTYSLTQLSSWFL